MATKIPLTILVLPPVDKWAEEIAELKAKGHAIHKDVVCDWDLIVGERAWHMGKAHKGMLAKAVEAAQRRVKGKGK